MNRKSLKRAVLPAICLALAQCTGSTTETPAPPTAFATLRLNLVGSGDQSFGGGKTIVVTDVDPALSDFAIALAIQPDNKIVVGGSNGFSGQGQIALVRYNSDGSLDAGFGTGGIVKTVLGSPASASAIAIDPSSGNKIVVGALLFTPVAGSSTGNTSMTVLRYNTDGTLDNSFGTQGIAQPTPVGTGLVDDSCAILLQNGKVVVAAASQDGKVVLARYDSAGVLDTAFGPSASGTTTTTVGAVSTSFLHRSPGMAAQSDGRIILVTRNNDDQAVMRYSVDGMLDTGFGGGTTGIVITDIGSSVNYANAVAIQSPGMGAPGNVDKIVVAGHAFVSDATSDVSLVRYSKDGVLDASFGTGGIVTTNIANQFDNALGIVLQDVAGDEPRILVAGNTGLNGFTQTMVLRYIADGTPDSSFGSRQIGQVFVPLVGPSTAASGNAIAIQPGLGIVVAGFD